MTPRQTMCRRKRRYRSKADADGAITQLALDGQDIAGLHPYRCAYGDHWHFGHARKGKKVYA